MSAHEKDIMKKADPESLPAPLDGYHPADIAEAISVIDGDERKLKAFARLGVEIGSEVLPLLDDASRDLILKKISPVKLGHLIGEMNSDDAADILGEIDVRKVENILGAVPADVDMEVSRLMEFHEETAGGLMQTELISVPGTYTVSRTLDEIRSRAEETGEFHNIFVVDGLGRLVGVVPLNALILKPADSLMTDLAEEYPLIYAEVDMDQEKVAEIFKRYDVVSLPVVGEGMTLLGRILIDDIVDVMEAETNEDIMIMAGADDEALIQTYTALEMVRFRLPWLGTSLVGGFITGALIWEFKSDISEALALAAFIPVVMGMSGNVGAQSSALVIRGLATGKVVFGQLMPYFLKELRVGLLLGIICGSLAGIVAQMWQGSAALGLVVGISICLSISAAALLGVAIPLLFRKMKIDPAIAGGPIVLAMNDISGLLIFFVVASVLLNVL